MMVMFSSRQSREDIKCIGHDVNMIK